MRRTALPHLPAGRRSGAGGAPTPGRSCSLDHERWTSPVAPARLAQQEIEGAGHSDDWGWKEKTRNRARRAGSIVRQFLDLGPILERVMGERIPVEREERMTVRHLFVVDGLLGMGSGAGLVGAPGLLLSLFGLEADPAREFLARMLGASLIGHGLLLWLTRDADAVAVRSIVRAHLWFDVIAAIAFAAGVLAGLVNPFGWTVVVVFAVLAALRFYFGFIHQSATTA